MPYATLKRLTRQANLLNVYFAIVIEYLQQSDSQIFSLQIFIICLEWTDINIMYKYNFFYSLLFLL